MSTDPLARLQARLAARQSRLEAKHASAGVSKVERINRCRLETLGPYVAGEPQAKTRYRARLEASLPPGRPGVYSDPTPLPETEPQARAELATIGERVWGESGYVSRRRAALQRIAPDLPKERVPHRKGGWFSEPQPVPDNIGAIDVLLREIGPVVWGEPARVRRRRAELNRAKDQLVNPRPATADPATMKPVDVLRELQALGAWSWGESMRVSRRRKGLQRRADSLGLDVPHTILTPDGFTTRKT